MQTSRHTGLTRQFPTTGISQEKLDIYFSTIGNPSIPAKRPLDRIPIGLGHGHNRRTSHLHYQLWRSNHISVTQNDEIYDVYFNCRR